MILRYFFAWFPMTLIAVVNGIIREYTYKPYTGELTAHQISTLTLILFLTAYIWRIEVLWNPETSRTAFRIGVLWCMMTLLFEFGFGHFVAGHSWTRLFEEYNLNAGRIWILIPIWILVGPVMLFRTIRRAPSQTT